MQLEWSKLQSILTDVSETAIRNFLVSLGDRKLIAIGYVFELGNTSPQFDLCANTANENHESFSVDDDERWNSGNYAFPAGMLDSRMELGAEWNAANAGLHELAEDEYEYDRVYAGLIDISCNSMISLAVRDLFPYPMTLDYKVSEVGDDLPMVETRHIRIRNAIKNGR